MCTSFGVVARLVGHSGPKVIISHLSLSARLFVIVGHLSEDILNRAKAYTLNKRRKRERKREREKEIINVTVGRRVWLALNTRRQVAQADPIVIADHIFFFFFSFLPNSPSRWRRRAHYRAHIFNWLERNLLTKMEKKNSYSHWKRFIFGWEMYQISQSGEKGKTLLAL